MRAPNNCAASAQHLLRRYTTTAILTFPRHGRPLLFRQWSGPQE